MGKWGMEKWLKYRAFYSGNTYEESNVSYLQICVRTEKSELCLCLL